MVRKNWRKLYDLHTTAVCPYCLHAYLVADMTIEHEPPKSRQKELGTSHTVLACKKCNNQKGALTADEYVQWKRLEFIRNGGLNQRQK